MKCVPLSRAAGSVCFISSRILRIYPPRITSSGSTPFHTYRQPPHSCCYQLHHASTHVAAAAKDSQTEIEQVATLTVPMELERRLERFIPVTQRTILQLLVKDKHLLSSEDKRLLETLVSSLDAKYSQRFYGILEETKVCDMFMPGLAKLPLFP